MRAAQHIDDANPGTVHAHTGKAKANRALLGSMRLRHAERLKCRGKIDNCDIE
jgi:hypothetical protein